MAKIYLPIILAATLFCSLLAGSAQAYTSRKASSSEKAVGSSTLTQTNRAEEGPRPTANTEKVLNDVKVYPNPVSSQLNLSYRITKDANVTIKIMDILGGEIAVLFSKQVSAGEQTNSFPTPSNLSSGGIYFIQIIAGDETIVKRIFVS